MKQFGFLDKLLNFEPGEARVVSIFLNTGPNETGKKDFEVFLRKQLKEHGSVIAAETPQAESYAADQEKIESFISRIDPSTKGVAIFASHGSGELFEAFQFAIPFEENLFDISDRPHLQPLIRLISNNPVFAVAAVDTNKAHIYVFKRGHTVDVQDIENTVTNRSEVGGWSQMRYQRHIDNFHQQHAKEVAAELDKLVRDENIKRILLAGDETVIIPMLKEELSNEVSSALIDTIKINVDTPEHEILEIAGERLKQAEADLDREKIGNLTEQNYEGGVGVVGVEKTLQALFNGQVQELYLCSSMDDIQYNRGEVRQILRNYEPGEDGELPDAAERTELINDLLVRAATMADDIRFIEDPQLLKTMGGIGALLRYQIKGVSGS